MSAPENSPSTTYFPDLDRAYESAGNVEQSLKEFAALRDGQPSTQHDADAIYSLATLLEKGTKGLEPDPARSVQLFTRAIDMGHIESLTRLASLLEEGADGVDPDHTRAVSLYTRAVEEGASIEAMKTLHCSLRNAQKVEKMAMLKLSSGIFTPLRTRARPELCIILQLFSSKEGKVSTPILCAQ